MSISSLKMEFTMHVLASNYSFNFITNNIQFSPDSSGITKLVPLITQGYLPSITDEFINGVPGKVLRLEKNGNSIGEAIVFRGEVLSVEISSENIIDIKVVESKLQEIVNTLSPHLIDFKSTRISSVINVIIDNKDQDFENKIYTSIFKDENNFFEWSAKRVSEEKIDGEEIFSNVSVHKGYSIKTQNGVFQNLKTITITADNNTIPSNQGERFDFTYSNLLIKLFTQSLKNINEIIMIE